MKLPRLRICGSDASAVAPEPSPLTRSKLVRRGGTAALATLGFGVAAKTASAAPTDEFVALAPLAPDRNVILAGADVVPLTLRGMPAGTVPLLELYNGQGNLGLGVQSWGSSLALYASSTAGTPNYPAEILFYDIAEDGTRVHKWTIGPDTANRPNDDLVLAARGLGGGQVADFLYVRAHSSDKLTLGVGATPPADTHTLHVKGIPPTQGLVRLDTSGGAPGDYISFYSEGDGKIASFEHHNATSLRLRLGTSAAVDLGSDTKLRRGAGGTLIVQDGIEGSAAAGTGAGLYLTAGGGDLDNTYVVGLRAVAERSSPNWLAPGLAFFTMPTGSSGFGSEVERLRIRSTGVWKIANADAAPTGNPNGGGYLYADGGSLNWRGPSGAIASFGAGSASGPVVVVQNAPGQTGDSQQWNTAAGVTGIRITSGLDLELANGTNVVLGTGAGTKLGTSKTQKLGVFGHAPVEQQKGGPGVAGLVYGVNEQGMVQRMYDALRAYGWLS